MSNQNLPQPQQRRSTFAMLANEITQLVIGEALGGSQIRVMHCPNGSGVPLVRISQNVLQIALTSRQFQQNLVNVINTLTCVSEARPLPGQISPRYSQNVRTVVLEEGHGVQLDITAFPNLHTIICKHPTWWWSPLAYVAHNLDTDCAYFGDWWRNKAVFQSHRQNIRNQVMVRLPPWIQGLLVNQTNSIDVQIPLHMYFRQGFRVRNSSWDTDIQYPPMEEVLSCLYGLRSGYIFDIRTL